MPPTTAARWITISAGQSARSRRTAAPSTRSYSSRRGVWIRAHPRRLSASTTYEPRNPPAPVTRTRRLSQNPIRPLLGPSPPAAAADRSGKPEAQADEEAAGDQGGQDSPAPGDVVLPVVPVGAPMKVEGGTDGPPR